jgi:hypothetical protein
MTAANVSPLDRLVARLRSDLGADAFDLVDNWEADEHAIGLGSPRDPRVLVYVSVDPDNDNAFYVDRNCLQNPTATWPTELPARPPPSPTTSSSKPSASISTPLDKNMGTPPQALAKPGHRDGGDDAVALPLVHPPTGSSCAGRFAGRPLVPSSRHGDRGL